MAVSTRAAEIGCATHNEDAPYNANHMSGTRFKAACSFTATVMRAYLITPGGKLSMAVYSNSSGKPGTRLGETHEIAATRQGWDTAGLKAAVSIDSGSYYWLMFNTNSNDLEIGIMYGSGVNKTKARIYGTWPATFGTPDDDWLGKVQMQAMDTPLGLAPK
jgi:hypothetical protein